MTLGNEPKIIVPYPLARGGIVWLLSLDSRLMPFLPCGGVGFPGFYVVGCLYPCRSPLRAHIRTFCRLCYPKY